jgi:hypothetical protein
VIINNFFFFYISKYYINFDNENNREDPYLFHSIKEKERDVSLWIAIFAIATTKVIDHVTEFWLRG